MKRLLYTLALMVTIHTNATPVKFGWDNSPTVGVTSYNLYWGPAPHTYTNMVSCGSVTNFTVTNLTANTKYWFAATSTSTNGLESDFSNEAIVVPPTNVVVFIVSVLSASDPVGPYITLTNINSYNVTNPAFGMEFIRAKVSVLTTNIAK
jgi:hypothetical protein